MRLFCFDDIVLGLEDESASGGGEDDADNDKDEGDFAEFAEDAPDDDDGNEGDDPDDEGVDAEIVADGFHGVGGAVHDLLAGFGDLVDLIWVDIGGVIDDIFHTILASYDKSIYYYSIKLDDLGCKNG